MTRPASNRTHRSLVLAVALAALPVLSPTLAQGTTGTVVVTVGKTSVPESRALHILMAVTTADAAARLVRTDSSDDRKPFTMLDVPAGRYRLEARVIGFIPETSFVDVVAGKTATVAMELREATVVLQQVDVAGNGKGHLADFERRRKSGKGAFITREDIERKGTRTISEALRGIRGLRVECQSTCTAQMVRSTTCEPRYFINGFPSDSQILLTPVLDVAGIEIYRGPSEMPGEFMGGDSMCGAIAIWTK